jgi:uncharacterized protein YwqG
MRPAIERTPTSPTQSYVGGHPFVAADADLPWPVDQHGRPMVHLLQVNFAALPSIPGFPAAGLLQWFCAGDPNEAHGLTFDGPEQAWTDSGCAGGARPTSPGLRADRRSQHRRRLPLHSTPQRPRCPLLSPEPVALQFSLEPSLPGSNDEVAGVSLEYDESSDLLPMPRGCHVGGHPYLMQADPRPQHPDRAATLLVQLDSDETGLFEWGDMGTAQLFGDPAELAHGRMDSLWWDWPADRALIQWPTR